MNFKQFWVKSSDICDMKQKIVENKYDRLSYALSRLENWVSAPSRWVAPTRPGSPPAISDTPRSGF